MKTSKELINDKINECIKNEIECLIHFKKGNNLRKLKYIKQIEKCIKFYKGLKENINLKENI